MRKFCCIKIPRKLSLSYYIDLLKIGLNVDLKQIAFHILEVFQRMLVVLVRKPCY